MADTPATNNAPAPAPAKLCAYCTKQKPALKRPKTGDLICRDCFYDRFETEIHETIVNAKLFKRGERVCIAASGGKGT